MASKTTPANDNDGWTTVAEESATQIKFDTDGDTFTGVKVGSDRLTARDGNEFTVYLFRAHGAQNGIEDGEFCSIAESYKLQALAEIPDGHLVRVTRTKLVDVGRPQPMTDYKIESKPL
jgi:hypothetical protein